MNYWNYESEISRVDRSETHLQIVDKIFLINIYERNDGVNL